MEYYSKTIILHQVESGFSSREKPFSCICRFEYDSGILRCHLTINNFLTADSGDFYFCLVDEKNELYIFNIDTTLPTQTLTFPTIPKINKDFSSGIFFTENNIPMLIAYTKCFNGIDMASLKKMLYNKYIESPNVIELPEIKEEPVSELFENTAEKIYDDEAVATENYFKDDELKKQMEFIEKFENFGVDGEEKEKEKEKDGETDFKKEEEYSENNPFYLTVKQEIEDILQKFPIEEKLSSLIPNSKFVKINYAENKYYTVGIIKDKGKEKYICYGVPDKYALEPPKELKGYCQFVPVSMFNVTGDGYWMMFQDAVNGTCVKMK